MSLSLSAVPSLHSTTLSELYFKYQKVTRTVLRSASTFLSQSPTSNSLRNVIVDIEGVLTDQ
jgi:hypothetical protein